ncbi:TrkH family potassium uptake protein [Pararhizobium antarcticum]|nr:potassium transporter TrkG [Pararhizobium antarcticum]
MVPIAFLIAIAIGTLLLMLPSARTAPGATPFLTALFTATSAVSVTGLIIVDTTTYWSRFGQGIILALIQVGGFGIMTAATLLGLLITRKLRLSRLLIAKAETRSIGLGDVKDVMRLILAITLGVEALTAAILTIRLHGQYGLSFEESLWHGIFHSVSAFNNAGFSTFSDSLKGFAPDFLVLVPIMFAVIVGGLGFPVLFELRQGVRHRSQFSIHTKITIIGTALLLVVGFVGVAAYEWANPATLGPMTWPEKLLNAMSHSVMTRTAGFNSIEIGELHTETLTLTNALMLIGGGSAGTAGGIKVTTFLLLGFVVWAEIRGEQDSNIFRRRIGRQTQRQALTVVLLSLSVIAAGVLFVLSVTDFSLDVVLFEVISAFATVGLSTGITASLPPSALYVIIAIMFIGRVGTIAVASALALRERHVPYRYPEERPIVG